MCLEVIRKKWIDFELMIKVNLDLMLKQVTQLKYKLVKPQKWIQIDCKLRMSQKSLLIQVRVFQMCLRVKWVKLKCLIMVLVYFEVVQKFQKCFE